MGSLLVSFDDRAVILDRLLNGRASPLLVNFLKVVSRHGRLDSLRAIHHQAHRQYDEMRGRVRVQLITAAPLDEQALARAGRAAPRQPRRRADHPARASSRT